MGYNGISWDLNPCQWEVDQHSHSVFVQNNIILRDMRFLNIDFFDHGLSKSDEFFRYSKNWKRAGKGVHISSARRSVSRVLSLLRSR